MQEIFKKLDANGDGRVDVEEYEALVKNLARQFPALFEVAANSRELFVQADTNKDGTLDRDEFAGLLRSFDAKLTRLPSTATGMPTRILPRTLLTAVFSGFTTRCILGQSVQPRRVQL